MPNEDRASPLKRFLMTGVVPPAATALIRLLGMSWRFRETGREHLDAALADPRPTILAFLHGRTFVMFRHVARIGGWVSMCSKSLDGEAMARVEERLGLDVVRGSSGRDGLQAIQEMIRRVRRTTGPGAAIAVDGSRGPRGRVQGGVIRLARWTGGTILPLTAAARPAHILHRSWDRGLIPLPFARIDVVYGEPVEIPDKINAHVAQAMQVDLEEQMVGLQAMADQLAGHGDSEPVRAPLGDSGYQA